ncbi:MAG: penicillin-binding protein 2, partial [Alphaproteobacteria bacterium HGW-Alphaproteobacteria-2]
MKRPSRNTGEAARNVTRRGLVLGGLQAAVAAVLIARMRDLQVAEADKYRLLAEENRINMRLLPPTRGLIFDRQGVLLAENRPSYRIVMVREEAGDVAMVLDRLQALLGFDDAIRAQALAELGRRSPFVPVTVLERVSWDAVAQVSVNSPVLPGVTAEVALVRHYPLDTDFTHIVGYVGPVSDYDLARLNDPDPLLQIPRFQIGKFGAEAELEESLRGRAGTRRIEVNAAGRVIREIERQEGTPGADVQLTVDHALQNFVQARLGSESAAVVVMDVTNGDILASGSAPSFDPNAFVQGISGPAYRALLENDHRPLSSKSVQGIYPPGSTFKMVVALAALEAGVVRPNDTVFCRGHYETSGRRFHCWKRPGHGHMDLLDSLAQSCDVYYYEIAQRVGIDRISAMARKLGIGVSHDVPLSGVAPGLAPDRDWKQRRRGESWVIGDTLNAGIGQGFVLASPLQLA